MKKLTKSQLEARFQAFYEAAEHLRLGLDGWTDVREEAEQGYIVADFLEREGEKYLLKAKNFEKSS